MNRLISSVFSVLLLLCTTGVHAWQQPDRYHAPYYGADSYLYRAERPYGYRQGVNQRQGIRIVKASDADGYSLRIYTRGMRPEDISISTMRGRIRLEAEAQAWRKWRNEQQNVRASMHGRFVRTLSLPRDADVAGMETRVTDGMLEIRIPRR